MISRRTVACSGKADRCVVQEEAHTKHYLYEIHAFIFLSSSIIFLIFSRQYWRLCTNTDHRVKNAVLYQIVLRP